MDYPAVLRMAHERKAMMEQAGNPQSAQRVIDGAEPTEQTEDTERKVVNKL